MTEIQYFRLNSAAQILNTSENIILDFAEQGLVILSTLCLDTWGVVSQGYRQGIATAVFKGYGNLLKTDVIKIASKGEADVSVLGMTPDCVKAINHKYPFKVPLPNNMFDVWQKPAPDPEKRARFYFHIKPYERASNRVFIPVLKNIFEPLTEDGKSALDIMNKNQDVYAGLKRIFKDDLRISAHELEKLKHYLQPEKAKPVRIIESPKRPIDKLLARMLSDFPNERPVRIWRILQEDVLRQERLHDTDEILDEVGDNELHWFKPNGETESMKKKSFFNSLANLKKIHSSKES